MEAEKSIGDKFMSRILEQRFISGVSFRMGADNAVPTITGYAAHTGVLSHDLGGWKERLKSGVFLNSLSRGDDVICNINHNVDRILGRRKNGTLALREDSQGLNFSCLLPDTSDGRDVRALIKRGDLSECSFAFSVDPHGEDWDEEDDDEDRGKRCMVRTLRSVKLHDVAVVAQPAYPSTSVSTNADPMSMDGFAQSPRALFPNGIPAEVRNHLGAPVFNPKAQESRLRLTRLFIG